MTDQSNTRFNAEAAAWDNNPDVHRASDYALEALVARFPQLKKAADNKNAADNGLDVLEIGCGTGLLSFRLSPYVRRLVAVDAATGMIDALEAKLQQPNAPKNVTPLALMLIDPEDSHLPAATNENANGAGSSPRKKFDLVISHLVLHHIPDLPGVLKTMHGCLKPGGHIALTDYEDFGPEARRFHPEAKMEGVERHGINRKEFEQMIKEAGFDEAKCDTGFVMRKDVEKFPGQWGQKKPSAEELGSEGHAEMDFPFLICLGRRP